MSGFWLGVCGDGVARFAVGGPAFWPKWTGTELLVRGRLSTLGGEGEDDRLRWIGADGGDIAYLMAAEGWGHLLEVGVPIPDAPATPASSTWSWTATSARRCGCGSSPSGARDWPVRKY